MVVSLVNLPPLLFPRLLNFHLLSAYSVLGYFVGRQAVLQQYIGPVIYILLALVSQNRQVQHTSRFEYPLALFQHL